MWRLFPIHALPVAIAFAGQLACGPECEGEITLEGVAWRVKAPPLAGDTAEVMGSQLEISHHDDEVTWGVLFEIPSSFTVERQTTTNEQPREFCAPDPQEVELIAVEEQGDETGDPAAVLEFWSRFTAICVDDEIESFTLWDAPSCRGESLEGEAVLFWAEK
jgi:hypothetical protein